MTSRERVRAFFQGRDVDSIPVINPTSVATIESMRHSGAAFPKAHIDPEQMAHLAATGHEILHFDTISPYFSVQLEAAALGCDIDWGVVDSMPSIVRSPFKEIGEISIPERLLDAPPLRGYLSALRILRKRYPNAALCGKVMGPLTLAYHLFGVPNVVMDILLAEDRVVGVLTQLVEISLALARAQVIEGIDLLTWADHATSDLVSAQRYAEILLPIHRRAAKRLEGKVPVVLHVCGRIDDRVRFFRESGFSAVQAHSPSNYAACVEAAGDSFAILGGVNNPKTLASGSAADIRQEVARILRTGVQLVTPECAVPPRMSNANLSALVEAARNRQVFT